MAEIEAIRQIRRLDKLAIEKAFSEEEYPALPDVLKIELVQRLEQLRSEEASRQRKSASLHPLLSFSIVVIGLAVLVKVMTYLAK